MKTVEHSNNNNNDNAHPIIVFANTKRNKMIKKFGFDMIVIIIIIVNIIF